MQVPKIIFRTETQAKIKHASSVLYKVAKTAYGPKSGNVILGFTHADPLLSHDGITNIKMVDSEDPFESDIIKIIRQASEKNNQKVGDGTTAVIILTHPLILETQKMEAQGLKPREIVSKLREAETVALDYLDSISQPVKNNLEEVATISAGDKAIGQMLSDIMKEVGKDGGVVIEAYEGLGIHPEIVDGFYFGKGFKETALINDPSNNQSNHTDMPVLISSEKFTSEVDIAPILKSLRDGGFKEFLLIADVGDGALKTLAMSKSAGIIHGVVVEPPYVSGGRSLFLDDIAIMCGAKVYEGVNFDPKEYLGLAKEVLVNAYSTTVIGGDMDKKAVKDRIKQLRVQLKEVDHPLSIQFAKERLARLSGKMAIIKVGGALEFEREELKLRIQDAVCAVQSALKEGIVPGGGCALVRVQGTAFDDIFKTPFRQLMKNADLNPESFLAHLEGLGAWYGFDLNNLVTEPEDMLKLGVIDPTIVIKEVVRNAVSIVCGLITAGAELAYSEKE